MDEQRKNIRRDTKREPALQRPRRRKLLSAHAATCRDDPWHGGGDVIDCHGGTPPRDPNRISLDSETCGFSLACPGHQWPGKPWATGTYDPKKDGERPAAELYALDERSKRWYSRRLADFYAALWRDRDRTGSSGDVKVQPYDVENESNGMLSYDRAVWKVDATAVAEALSAVSARAQDGGRSDPRPELAPPPPFAQ